MVEDQTHPHREVTQINPLAALITKTAAQLNGMRIFTKAVTVQDNMDIFGTIIPQQKHWYTENLITQSWDNVILVPATKLNATQNMK